MYLFFSNHIKPISFLEKIYFPAWILAQEWYPSDRIHKPPLWNPKEKPCAASAGESIHKSWPLTPSWEINLPFLSCLARCDDATAGDPVSVAGGRWKFSFVLCLVTPAIPPSRERSSEISGPQGCGRVCERDDALLYTYSEIPGGSDRMLAGNPREWETAVSCPFSVAKRKLCKTRDQRPSRGSS